MPNSNRSRHERSFSHALSRAKDIFWRYGLLTLAVITIGGCSSPKTVDNATNQPPTSATDEPATRETGDWPFTEAQNVAVITLKRVLDRSHPILYVVHDENGDWQFLDKGDVTDEDAATVALRTVVSLDPSIKSLADLPVGWAAARNSLNEPWERFQR